MNRDYKLKMKSIILSQHRDHLTIGSAMTEKKAPISELFSSNLKHSRHSHGSFSEHFGSSFIKKNYVMYQSKHLNRQEESPNTSDINLDDKKVKFYVPSHSDLSSENNFPHSTHHHHKHLRSTFNLFKNSFHHSKTKHADLNSIVDIESFAIMVGKVDFLDRPVMAFVRLTKEQFLDHLVEFEIKVKFLFIFLGPDKPSINYLEIGRCMGTLMTNKDFLDCAYNAKNKQEIIRGITAFMNRSLCLVLPAGEFDEDLLTPLIDWMKKKMMKKQRQIMKIKDIEMTKQKKIELRKESFENKSKDIKENFDPFKRTGKCFGSLINEINHRYKKYFSDIADGFNLHCLIAICFIFTVCIAPALCFGGILGKYFLLKYF